MTIKAFITGGTGFVGTNLVRLLLEQGYQVRVLVRPNSCLNNLKNLDVEQVKGDLNGPDLAAKIRGTHILFHVAAHYSFYQQDRRQLYQSNVLGTRSILEAARQARIERTVYTSSVAAIGVGKSGQIINETYQSPVEKLVSHYKKSKYWAEQEAHKAVQNGQDVVIVNPSTPIGPWDIKPTPTGKIILRFLRRQMPAYVDTGLNVIDVRDVAWGHLLALEKGKSGERYLLGHKNLSLKRLLEELATITRLNAPQQTVPFWLPLTIAWIEESLLAPLGRSPSLVLDEVRMSQFPMYYDGSKAVKELGLPQSSVKQALQDAVTWFVNHRYV
ncbi:hopanoid-associated sugar epimerase [cyanobacterium endosymbiont of Epithemia turgida]|uniref:hopanoid-associated sugar epimerase n=1 Tax=cyanobacterium endosymbiont of Epithemia turgida TaxID=718217 RepID=UPI0004D136DB|nr:hopanoid-associated sugar epimerase [cyanobacterium endosymbiont of Epithemia turgida]BAP17156.1 dihydrokaempferol 4-reductase [cyanobacterium endosymbiont of Epithemia turgida isolate EtSB Lake Yunoko]